MNKAKFQSLMLGAIKSRIELIESTHKTAAVLAQSLASRGDFEGAARWTLEAAQSRAALIEAQADLVKLEAK